MPHQLATVRVCAFGIAGVLLACSLPAAAQQFSADIASANANAPSTGRLGKIHVENDKVRIETPDLPDSFFLVDGAEHVAYFVRPAPRIFMESKQTSQLTQILVPLDPTDPCRQWQRMAVVAGAADQGGRWLCERVGEDRIDGRSVTVYRATSPTNRYSTAWIDPRLRFALRLQTEDGMTFDLRNIQEGPQRKSLFEIPSNYRKFDPAQLIERIKKSDVWVERPK
jgi:hypothetical protein